MFYFHLSNFDLFYYFPFFSLLYFGWIFICCFIFILCASMLFGHPFQCIAFCHHVFVGNFLTRTVYLFSVHCKSASMFIEALDIFYSFAIFLQFGSFFFSRLTVENRHFLCTGNHRKQFSAASKIKRSMNQYSLLEMCFGGIFHNIFFLSLLVFLARFSLLFSRLRSIQFLISQRVVPCKRFLNTNWV